MKKLVFITLITLTYTTQSQILLDSVTVTSNRAQTPFNEAMREVNVIQQDEIKSAPVETINEMLEYSPGLDVRQRGGFDIQSDISVRGGTFDQTLVLLNGMKMNDPQTGHHNMNLPITSDLIEQVEVLQGGASRVYGPNAFAGAINFRTKRFGENMLGARVMGGQYGLFQGNVYAGVKTGNAYTIVSLDHLQSDGFRYNTDFIKDNIYLQSAIKINENNLIVNLGSNKKSFGAQTFYSSNFPDQFEETRTQFASLQWEGRASEKLTYSINGYMRRNYDRFELFREGVGYWTVTPDYIYNSTDTVSWYTDHNYHRTDVRGLEGDLTYDFGIAGKTSFGIDYRHENIVSSLLGKPLEEPINAPGEIRGVYTKGDFRDNYSIYAEHNYNSGNFGLSAGLMFNYNTSFGNDILPGIDVSYQVSENNLLYASYNKSFRFPTFTDLYYNLGGAMGSENLRPEYSHNIELGWKHIESKSFYSASIFRRMGTDMIDWVFWAPDSIVAENITEVNLNGLSLQYGIQNIGNMKWINRVSLSYNFLIDDDNLNDNETADNEYPSLYVLDYLSHKVTLNFNHSVGLKGLSFDWRLSYQDRNGSYYNAIEGKDTPYDNVLLFDAKINYNINQVDLFVEGSNLLDIEYVDRGNVYQPGIWLRGGISVSLK